MPFCWFCGIFANCSILFHLDWSLFKHCFCIILYFCVPLYSCAFLWSAIQSLISCNSRLGKRWTQKQNIQLLCSFVKHTKLLLCNKTFSQVLKLLTRKTRNMALIVMMLTKTLLPGLGTRKFKPTPSFLRKMFEINSHFHKHFLTILSILRWNYVPTHWQWLWLLCYLTQSKDGRNDGW